MEIKNQKDWIVIEFERYAVESDLLPEGLTDGKNYVEISYSFGIRDDEWCLVLGDYIHTKEIKTLYEGFTKLFYGAIASFTCSAGRFLGCPEDKAVCRFDLRKIEENIEVSLEIFHGPCGSISVTEWMRLPDFEKLVNELKAVAREFPVIAQ